MRLVPFETNRDDGSSIVVFLNPEHVLSVRPDRKDEYILVVTSDGGAWKVKGHPTDIAYQLMLGDSNRE